MHWLVARLKDVTFLWVTAVGAVTGGVAVYNDCEVCLDMYRVEITFFAVTLLLIAAFWVGIYRYIKLLHVQWLVSEIDRLHFRLKDKDTVTVDDAKHLMSLEERRIALRLNSFNERKLAHLLAKEIEE